MEEKRIIEINGVKLEIDLSTAKRVDEFRVGDKVKVLKKEYGDDFVSYAGTIIGFDNFKNRPTIIIAYLKKNYNTAEIQFVYYNKDTENVEIVHANENDILFSKDNVLEMMDKMILKAEEEVRELRRKRQYFLDNFGASLRNKIMILN